ncbi:MAG: hypothetical protein KGI78_00395 [Patescibacteria group bacterium]|nr:hypothetical protein [Patescibacteria group bacterium]MDE1944852.1 hypothetical protein [Patescibacteria group bacterium]MDE2057298.1 hypothetical protein [Patescibacteria group bacterium]
MNHIDTPHGIINAASQRFFGALGENASEVANRINTEPAFLAQLAAFATNGGFQPSTSQQKAREIMGAGMFGVEDAIKHFGVNPSKTQLAALAEVPFTEEALAECKDTHVLFAVFPLSILDIRAQVKGEPSRLFYDQTWYNKEAFAKDRGEIGWYLIRKTPVENSTSKSWDEQQALLSTDDETPKAQAMVYAIIGHYKATGERLFEKIWVRCSDRDSDGYRVHVGLFDAEGLDVSNFWDDGRDDDLGLSSARKSS